MRLKDVATVKDGLENTRVGGWYNGKPAVIVDVQRQPGANVIDTVARIKAELPRVERSMPAGVNLQIVSDRTGTIRASVHDVQFTLVLSVGLVVMVVLLFLRSLRATIIAGVALPVSLIATFGVMYFCGFSVDNLSLMALTIGTGFVVDDAIVMIENIVRHLEKGEKPMKAALDGAREIGFTVISLTMSLIAVFIPLLFMTGLVGRMFREFALTLTIAVVVSAIVSLTLTPMMCSRLLSAGGHERAAGSASLFGRFMDAVIRGYGRSLEFVLRHQPATLFVALITVVITIWLYVIMPKGFLPDQDTGAITAVIEGGPQISFAEMSRLQGEVAAIVSHDPDVSGVASIVGIGQLNATQNVGSLKIMLKPRDERQSNVLQIIRRLKGEVASVAGTTVHFQPVQDVQISTQIEPRPLPVHACEHRRRRGLRVVEAHGRRAEGFPGVERRRVGRGGRRPDRQGHRRSRHGRTSRRHDAGGQRCAEQCLRPAPGLDHLRAGQPVSCRARSGAGISQRSRRA